MAVALKRLTYASLSSEAKGYRFDSCRGRLVRLQYTTYYEMHTGCLDGWMSFEKLCLCEGVWKSSHKKNKNTTNGTGV